MVSVAPDAILENVNVVQECKAQIGDKLDADIAAAEDAEKKNVAAEIADELNEYVDAENNKPQWQVKYNSVANGVLKPINDVVQNIVPDTGYTIGNINLDDIKLITFIFILFLIVSVISDLQIVLSKSKQRKNKPLKID